MVVIGIFPSRILEVIFISNQFIIQVPNISCKVFKFYNKTNVSYLPSEIQRQIQSKIKILEKQHPKINLAKNKKGRCFTNQF